MSTKTLRKRIALVAVSALGAGLLSIAPANAAAGDGVLQAASGSNVGVVGPIAGSALSKTATVLSTGQIAVTTADAGTIVVSAGAAIVSGGTLTTNQTCSTSATSQATTVVIKPTGAAGSTFTISGYDGDTCAATGALADVITVTIASSSNAGTASAANSTLNWYDGTGGLTTAGQDDSSADAATRGNPLYLLLVLKDVYSAAITTAGALTATVTSGAYVSVNGHATDGAGAGTYSTAVLGTALATGGKAVVQINEATAGAGWNGTVTVSYNGVVIATKSGKITGDATKIKVTPTKVGKNGAGSAVAFDYNAYDAAGNVVQITAANLLKDSSSNPAVVSAAVGSTQSNLTTGAAGTGSITCLTSGSSDVVLYYVTAAGTIIKSNSATFHCGAAADSYTASFDKSSYKQGEIAKLTVKFLDVSGKIANSTDVVSNATTADQVVTAPQLVRVTDAGGYTKGATVGADGTIVYTFTVGTDSGIVAGAYNAVVSFPTVNASNGANQSVAYTVTAGGTSISNADVLSAIVKLIASINKQIVALQKLLLKKK